MRWLVDVGEVPAVFKLNLKQSASGLRSANLPVYLGPGLQVLLVQHEPANTQVTHNKSKRA